jgi:hypothetical protein
MSATGAHPRLPEPAISRKVCMSTQEAAIATGDLACHAPHLTEGDRFDAFQRQWPGAAERVDVRQFIEGAAGEDAGALIG